MEKDLNHQGRQGEDRGDGIRRRPKEERQQTARRRPVGESETQAGQRRQENDRRGQSPNSRKQNPNAKNKKKKRAAFNVGSTAVLIVAVFVFVFSVFLCRTVNFITGCTFYLFPADHCSAFFCLCRYFFHLCRFFHRCISRICTVSVVTAVCIAVTSIIRLVCTRCHIVLLCCIDLV